MMDWESPGLRTQRLHLWSSDGVLGWAPSGVIELETLLPVRAINTGWIYMVSFVHGLGAFFVRVNAGAFIVDVVSGRVRKIADNRRARPCLVHSENQKVFKILRHIKSCGTCMKH